MNRSRIRPPHVLHPLAGAAALAVLVGSGAAAFAQDATTRIEVTGSLIKRVSSEGALPVSTTRAEDLQARGHTELKDFMLELPQAVSLGSFAGTAGPMTNLRGFGPMRTLTLLNGRRLAKEPLTSQYVSVSVMPRMALARVDILRDGASSAYGSDAIAGVQNFYTLKEYRGVSVKAEGLVPQRDGGGDYWSVGVLAGAGNLASQGWNAYIGAEVQKRKILLREERPELIDGSALNALGINTQPGLGANATPANFTDPTNPVAAQRTLRWNPYGTTCLPPYSKPSTSGGRQTCFLDANDTYTAFGNGNDITTIYGRGTLALGGGHTLGAEVNFARYVVLQNNAATPVTVRLTSTHPYYPGNGKVPAVAGLNLGGRPIDALWSVADAGPREREDFHTNERVVLSLEGALAGWDYSVALNHGWSERDTRAANGWMSVSGVATVGATGTTLFLDPRLNPFGLQDATGLEVLRSASQAGRTFRLHKATNTSLDATVTRELFKLGGGAAQLALGAEFRKDGWEAIGLASNDLKAWLNNQIDLLGGDAQAGGATSATSNKISRDISSAFAELEMPVSKALSFNAALRVDHYQDLKETTVNPKLAFRWQPAGGLLFRGSANTGFRAPSLPEIYSKETERTAIPAFDDPKYCPTINGVRTPQGGKATEDVCQLANRFQITKVPSNAGVTPEKSKSFTVGLVFEPWRNATVSVDYWQTQIDDVIGNRAINFILANHTLYPAVFLRNPTTDLLEINAVLNPPSNLGRVRGAGLDVSLAFTTPQAAWGRLTGQLDIAYLTKWDASSPEVNGGAWLNALGYYNDVVPVNPNAGLSNATRGLNHRWRHVATVGWQRGGWQVQLSQRYQSQVYDQNLPARTGAGTTGPRNVAAYEQYNLTATWKPAKQLKIGASVLNLFDRNPPQTNHNGYNGYLTSSVDVLGRAYRVSAEYTF